MPDGLTPKQVAAVLALLRSEGKMTRILGQVPEVAAQIEADLVLTTAVSGEADYLVTQDKTLLPLGSYQGVRVLGPKVFLGLFAALTSL